MHTVADRTPAAIEATRVAATGARETSAHLRDAMVERIPDGMVDRLPDALADHLGAKKPRRGRKLVLLAAALAVGGVGFAALRQKRNARHSTYTPAPPAPSAPPRAVADDPGAVVPPGEGTGTPDA